MTRKEAIQWLTEWFERFPRSDLFVVEKNEKTLEETLKPTDIGRHALDKMTHECREMNDKEFRSAAAAAELGESGFLKLAHVFKKAQEMRIKRAPNYGLDGKGVLIPPFPQNSIVKHEKFGWFGWVDKNRRPPSIWWVVETPFKGRIAFPTQYFKSNEFKPVQIITDEEAAEKKAGWTKALAAGSLTSVGLKELLGGIAS